MIAKDFSKGELIAILETIEAARNCDTEVDLKQLITQAKELVCADYCICGLGRKDNNALSDVLMLVNGNYPQEWVDIYMKEGLHKKDPVIKHLMQFLSTHLWSDIFRFYNDKTSIEFLDRANDFGLKCGITTGIFDPEMKCISVLSFAGNTNRFTIHNKKIVDIITLHLHRVLVRTYLTKQFHN
jgi:hypothetical protein